MRTSQQQPRRAHKGKMRGLLRWFFNCQKGSLPALLSWALAMIYTHNRSALPHHHDDISGGTPTTLKAEPGELRRACYRRYNRSLATPLLIIQLAPVS